MNKTKYFYLAFLLLFQSSLAAAERNPQIIQAIDLIFQEDYLLAAAVLDQTIAAEPSNPEGYFYRGVIFWRESTLAPEVEKYDHALQIWLDRCLAVADSNLAVNPRDVNAWFYRGGAHGFLGSMYARRGNWPKTGYHAWKGISALENARELNPEMYDIYYGLGLYHVMAGHQSAIVRFIQKLLPIPPGDPAQGIRSLKLAIEKGRYAPVPAQSALGFAWLYFENHYPQAIQTLVPLLEKYPTSTDLLLMLINAQFYQDLNHAPSHSADLLANIEQFERIIAARKIEINSWWPQKLVLLKGFAHYSLENDAVARDLLEQYSAFKTDHDSYLTGLAYLMLGKIHDSRGERDLARKKYRQAKAAEKFGNVAEVAEQALNNPVFSRRLPIAVKVTGFPERP